MEVEFSSKAKIEEIARETASLRLIAAARRATRDERRDGRGGGPPSHHPAPRLMSQPKPAA